MVAARLVLGVFWLSSCAALAACSQDTDATPVSVSGRAVEVVEYGTEGPAVIFESGLGDDWTPWESVARQVGEHARAFAYSRAGYGQSEPSAEPRDAAHIVAELRSMLAARHVAPPYVLVGHSLGGGYMELFAKAHPEQVAGVVLVDPRHRDFSHACEQAGLEGCSIPQAVLRTLPDVQAHEVAEYAHLSGEIDELGAFGPYPVRVLGATTHGFSPAVESLWESLLGSLAHEAEDGELSLFAGAGHYLQLERSDEVAQVILDLLPR